MKASHKIPNNKTRGVPNNFQISMNASEENIFLENITDFGDNSGLSLLQTLWDNGKWEIPLYSIIFFTAVVGNILVILTLCKRNRMKTITNVFLLNLAASDLVLTVLCMPFTLIGSLLRDFIFGKWMCKLVPFLQATSVATSVWTLVALSVERYYAICHPLRSRKWQTLSHARHLIATIWTAGAFFMLPIIILSELQPTKQGRNKCRENWPNDDFERAYNIFLDFLLLLVPLLILGVTYYLIATTLWKDLKGKVVEIEKPTINVTDVEETSMTESAHDKKHESASLTKLKTKSFMRIKRRQRIGSEVKEKFGKINRSYAIGLRHTNYERSLLKKQRVIKMLYVVVLEFFICWTPLYVINTLALFLPQLVYSTLGYKVISFCQLLAYSSGCCNPITYCFMNKAFRSGFISMFTCPKVK